MQILLAKFLAVLASQAIVPMEWDALRTRSAMNEGTKLL